MACTTLLIIYYISGAHDYILVKSYDKEFDYPLNIDTRNLIEQILIGNEARIQSINYYPYTCVYSASNKCTKHQSPKLVIAVKSALQHFEHRNAIRRTWGLENRFPNVTIKVLFFVGVERYHTDEVREKIRDESLLFEDLVQFDFIDDYFNNTIKTMMSFRWMFERCPNGEYYFFSDDDMYVSVKNLLEYVGNVSTWNRNEESKNDFLYSGYVFKSAPHRYYGSKWRVTLDEYPWDRWPPYVTAGAYVLNNKAMKFMYLGSLYTKHFRFDDIYLGIVAKKLGIAPVHSKDFYFYKKPYKKYEEYKDVIASHGFGNQEELMGVWKDLKDFGAA